MIDMIVLRCNFLDEFRLMNIEDLPISLEFRKDETGHLTNIRHPWESIPSHFHNLAVKINVPEKDAEIQYKPYIEIKASPAKLMFGHNVFGSDDLSICGFELIKTFSDHYETISGMLNINSWDVAALDITYASFSENSHISKQVISFLNNISHNQTKSSNKVYDGTAYFGSPSSRLKRLKVYLKEFEVYNHLKKLKKNRFLTHRKIERILEAHTNDIIEFTKCMIRWESTVKKRWLSRNDYPTNFIELCKVFDAKEIWLKSTNDIFESFRGQEMKVIKKDEMLPELNKYFKKRKAKNMFSFFKDIMNEGYNQATSSDYISSSSLSRYLSDFREIGISKAYLQNIEINENINVIPLIRFTSVDFSNQVPEFFDMNKFENEYYSKVS